MTRKKTKKKSPYTDFRKGLRATVCTKRGKILYGITVFGLTMVDVLKDKGLEDAVLRRRGLSYETHVLADMWDLRPITNSQRTGKGVRADGRYPVWNET